MKKTVIAMVMAAMMAGSLIGCGSSTSDTSTGAETTTAAGGAETTADASGENNNEAGADNVLVMATNAEFPPYEYHDGGDIVGIDVDVAKAIAEKLGMTLEIEDIAFDSIIPELQSGKAHLGIAGMTVDEDRLKNVDFTDPYTTAS